MPDEHLICSGIVGNDDRHRDVSMPCDIKLQRRMSDNIFFVADNINKTR